MKHTTLSWFLISGILATMAPGANLRYRTSGPWEDLSVWDPAANDGAGAWTGNGWMKEQDGSAPPDATDTVRANWGGNTVTLDYETWVDRFQIGVDESGTFHILDGGILNGARSNKVGNNNVCTGTLIIDAGGVVNAGSGWMMIAGSSDVTGIAEVSGTLNINGHLWMATGAGSSASLTINDGGVVKVGENIGLGTIAPASAETGGPATITVNEGGFLSLHHWHNTGSIRDGSVLNVNSGGLVIVGGNRVNAANDYIAAGKIATDASELLVSFNAEFNETTITTPRLPLVAEISPSGADLLLTWNGRSDSLYNVWSTADLSQDLAFWDEVESGVAGSGTTVTPGSSPLFFVVEEYPKPPAVTNGSFSDPSGIAADGFDVIGDPWVVDDAGLIETWNPEDPISYEGKPGGPNVAHVASNYEIDDTPFGISQVLNETFAENTNYTLTVRVGRSKLYDWPGYRVELWAGSTMLAFDDDTISTAPVAGKFSTSRLDYEAGTAAGIAPGTALEIRLLSRNVDVESVGAPEYDWAVDFDNVGFRSSQN